MEDKHERTRTRQPESAPDKTEGQEQSEELAEDLEENECEECGGTLTTDESAGEIVCGDCGLVADEQVIDRGPEWRAYNTSERHEKSRTGAPLTELRHDKGLSTDIDWKNRDAYGQQLSSRKRRQMQRLRKWDFRAKRDSGSNNIAYANGEIKRMGAALGVPKNIQETAAALYREAHNNDLIPGRSIEGMASATLYIALRVHNEPRSLDEVTQVARTDRKPLQRAYRYICRELNIGLEPTDPSRYVPRFATKLEAPQEIIKTAEDLLSDVTGTHRVSGNDPTVLAASALYAAAILEGTLLTQSDVKDASGVTEVSVRENYEMFLLHSSASPITEEHIENSSTPSELAEKIHDSVTYLSTDRGSSNSNTGEETSTESEDSDDNATTMIPENYELPCPDCDSTFDEPHAVLIHYANDHGTPSTAGPDNPNFSCPVCPRITDTYVGLAVHFHSTHPGQSLPEKVPEACTVDSDLNPIRDAYGDLIQTFDCNHCDEESDTYWELRVHQGQAHDGDRNPNDREISEPGALPEYSEENVHFSCQHCECVFGSYQGLSIHIGHEHSDTVKHARTSYLVNAEEYPVFTASDREIDREEEDSEPFTIGDTDTELLPSDEANLVTKRAEDLFDEYDHEFHPVVRNTTTTLLAVGGLNIGDCSYRSVETAIAAALYAAAKVTEPVVEVEYTQQDISDITGVSKNPISKGYKSYLAVFDDLGLE